MNKKVKPSMKALLCVDTINDIVDPKGKMATQTSQFVDANRTLQRISRIQEHFRDQGHLVLHAKTAFQDNYSEYPRHETSPVLTNELKEAGALQRFEWGTEFPEEVAPKENEPVIVKHRIGAFDRTRLEIILRTHDIEELYLVGGLTTRSIVTIAMNAHDKDFKVTVLADGCFDETDTDHDLGQKVCAKVAEVTDFDQIALRLTK